MDNVLGWAKTKSHKFPKLLTGQTGIDHMGLPLLYSFLMGLCSNLSFHLDNFVFYCHHFSWPPNNAHSPSHPHICPLNLACKSVFHSNSAPLFVRSFSVSITITLSLLVGLSFSRIRIKWLLPWQLSSYFHAYHLILYIISTPSLIHEYKLIYSVSLTCFFLL